MDHQEPFPDRKAAGTPSSPDGTGLRGWWGRRSSVAKWLLAPLGLSLLLPLLWFLLLPWPLHLRWLNPGETSFMAYRSKEARAAGEPPAIQWQPVGLADISPLFRRAVLVAEDDRFYQHHGIDWRALGEEVEWKGDTTFSWLSRRDRKALWEAIAYYRAHRDAVKGRSTITQQLAKNLYFTPERSLLRKVSEALVAKRLEWLLPKDRILELYLNVVELGPGIFGAEAAAQAYFGHGAQDLSLGEAAALAATLPHPLTSNPAYRPARMEWRRNLILHRLGAGLPAEPSLPELLLPPLDSRAPDTAVIAVPGDSRPGGG